jgi:hypothetical protein
VAQKKKQSFTIEPSTNPFDDLPAPHPEAPDEPPPRPALTLPPDPPPPGALLPQSTVEADLKVPYQ